MAAAPFDWSQYLRLADELSVAADEASLRSAISRAYYFVYHLALEGARANTYQPRPHEPTHAQLWRLFTASPESSCQRLGSMALRMKEQRERADYENRYPRIADDVPVILEDARRFADILNTVPARHPNPSSVRQ